ncbi:hypothetical protein Mic7113_0645 [Allocoleopsis franciscana PCC 7113]|uniref:Uncharacterized protein n=1 Tax=Allocoleopsis franciscana PCC 7113 TaxID=1173027 RepID=K9W8L8_9CYAN|nr:hypothetical protein Mic7113_0645 [Allocoleopsis franciscana PCC 7113]
MTPPGWVLFALHLRSNVVVMGNGENSNESTIPHYRVVDKDESLACFVSLQ